MTNAATQTLELREQFLKSLDKAHVGAAASKLFYASVGEVVTIFSRSPTHKYYSLADIEWMVLPAVTAGQFYVVEAADKERGFTASIAAVTWALVSEEVDLRLERQAERGRLRPDEWTSGEVGWLIDAVGTLVTLKPALQWLKAGPFKDRPLKLWAKVGSENTRVETLDDLMSAADAAEAATT